MITGIMSDMIGYFRHDVKRINHALKVYNFATLISKETNLDDQRHEVIGIAAILHDIGITEAERKYHSSSGKYQEIEGPPVAREIISQYNLREEVIERVCFIIGNHHSYSKIDDVDFQILVEADFLVNIFEDSMSIEAIQNLKDKIFKTDAGTRLLEMMYL